MSRDARPVVVFLAKLPPPFIGPAVATRIVLQSGITRDFRLIHLDLSDHRDIRTLAKWDFTNVFLALKHYLTLLLYLLRYRPALVYIPAGQSTVGYFRDAGFILLAALFRRKIVCHLRGAYFRQWYDSLSPGLRGLVRRIHSLTDLQIVLSDRLHPLFHGILPPERIFTVPNGTDIPDPEEKKAGDPLKVLYLSNYIRSKGVMDVLQAALLMQQQTTRAHFILCGDYSEAETKREMEAFLQAHPGIAVEVSGPRSGDEKARLLREADVFLLPTFYPNEGLPWAIIEAMAWRLPVISTRHAAIPDCVEEGVNGFLVEKNAPKEIVEAIQQLGSHPSLLVQMGNASRARYEARFTEAHFIGGLRAAFWQTLSS